MGTKRQCSRSGLALPGLSDSVIFPVPLSSSHWEQLVCSIMALAVLAELPAQPICVQQRVWLVQGTLVKLLVKSDTWIPHREEVAYCFGCLVVQISKQR